MTTTTTSSAPAAAGRSGQGGPADATGSNGEPRVPAGTPAPGAAASPGGSDGSPRGGHRGWRGIIEEYRERLPLGPDAPVVTLLEGGTPLVPAARLSELTGCDVYLKVEGANPTGSFKDRGMTVA